MLLIPALVLVGLSAYALTGARGATRAVLIAGLAILALSWAPLLLAILLDPQGRIVGNALGLGLLAWMGSLLGLLVLAGGLVARWLRG